VEYGKAQASHRATSSRDRDSDPARFLKPGDKLGEYRLLEPLAQCGMGLVYKAMHLLLKRVVARKVLPPQRLADAQAGARFRRELRDTGRRNHPNIIRAYDARRIKGAASRIGDTARQVCQPFIGCPVPGLRTFEPDPSTCRKMTVPGSKVS
jgi:hypothetical protein